MKNYVMTAVLAAALGMGATAAIAGHHEGGDHKGGMMQKVDTNADGMVSKAEFMAKHEEMFAKMDANNDGNLTKEEMKSAREMMKEKRSDMKEKYKMKKEMMGDKAAE
jgi:uncharacterized protein (DUF1800 family)